MNNVVRLADFRSRRHAAAATPTPASPPAAGVRLLTEEQLASTLGRSQRSLRRDRKAGMPAHPVGNGYRYDLAAVMAWNAAQRSEAS